MAQAKHESTTSPPIPLSQITRDPFVREAFLRAERDLGDDYAALVETDHPPSLDGGAAERLCQSTFRRSAALVEA